MIARRIRTGPDRRRPLIDLWSARVGIGEGTRATPHTIH